jgi:hypothetical protein
VAFDFLLLDRNEFLSGPSKFAWWNIHDDLEQMDLDAGSIAFTICQVPVMIYPSKDKSMEIHRADGGTEKIDGHVLDPENSRHLLRRDGTIHHLVVFID